MISVRQPSVTISRIASVLVHNRITRTIKFWMRRLLGKEKRFVDLNQYIVTHPNMSSFLLRNKEKTIYAIDQTSFDYHNVLKRGKTVDCFVVLLKHASCFAFSDLIVLHTGDYYSEIKNDPELGVSSDCNDGNVLIKDEKYSYHVDIPDVIVHLSNGILLSGLFSWNYFHFTFQIIPKLRWLSSIPSTIPLLVDQKVEDIPAFSALLKACNRQNRPVFIMKKRVRYLLDDLYLVSGQTFLEPNHKNGTDYPEIRCSYRPSTLDYLRETLIPIAKDDSMGSPKRIFLGRKYASWRRKFNEEECIECAKEFGFEVVFPELLTLQEQIRLFNNAEAIIGGSGAAFTNLIYCKKGVSVLVLSKFYPALGLWQPIVEYIGGRLAYVLETSTFNNNPSEFHAPFTIDIDKLRFSLNELLHYSDQDSH